MRDRRLVIAGWISAVLLQPVGVVLGLVLIVRGRRPWQGAAIVMLSLLLLTSLAVMVVQSGDDRECSELVEGLCR